MKILVIGGSGFIGSHILESISANHTAVGTFFSNSQIAIPGCSLEQLDVRDRSSVMDVVGRISPDVVIQVCGTKSIEFCEKNPWEAWAVHTQGTENVVHACLRDGIRLAYVSTDCVFEGLKQLYTEEDKTHPFNVYGRVKYEGERIIQNSGLNAVVIRASLLFGRRRCRKQASNFVLLVLDALKSKHFFNAASNLFNTPLEISQAARVIAALSLSSRRGIFHTAGTSRISRYDFAVITTKIFESDPSYIRPIIDTSGLRQPNSCLSVSKTEANLNMRLEGVREGLVRMASQLTFQEVCE